MAAFERVLITAPDRLARKYVHQVLLIEELGKHGCSVDFLDRPMSDDPHDRLLLQIRGTVAEYERSLIADRMRRGRQAKLRSGTLLPWTKAPYGYILDDERPRDPSRLHIDPVKAEVVKQIFAWYSDPKRPVSLYWVAKTLSERQIPTPSGKVRWNVASVRGILPSATYTGTASSGRTRPARHRKSALQAVGPGASHQPAPSVDWIAISVPAIISQETFDLAQRRLERNKQMARRNNKMHPYLLRGLVSCARCRLACSARAVHPGYHYYLCRGRTDALRSAQGERCYARYTPASKLDELVWQDLCALLRDPMLITHELERAQAGEWLPQALQDRRRTVTAALAQLERQQARLLEVYLAEVIGRDEFERKRGELDRTQQGLLQQLRELEAQAQKQLDVAELAGSIEAFCQRVGPTLDKLSFAQRRELVELLIDRVVVEDGKVEIRYVIPTSPKGEKFTFCNLRLDYFHLESQPVQTHQRSGIEFRVGRKQQGVAHLPWFASIQQIGQTQIALEVRAARNGRVKRNAGLDLAEIGQAAYVLKIHLAVVLTAPTGPLLMRSSVEIAQVGITTQFADQVQAQGTDSVEVGLLGIVAVGSDVAGRFGQVRGDLLKLAQIKPRSTIWGRASFDEGLVRGQVAARGCLANRDRVGIASLLINQGYDGQFQTGLVARGRAVPKPIQAVGRLTAFGDERAVGDDEHRGIKDRFKQSLVEASPVEVSGKVPGKGAFVIVAVAAHVAEGHATG